MGKAWGYGNIGVAAICYNEELLIRPWLDHLLESESLSPIVILLVDGTDNTGDIIVEYQWKLRGTPKHGLIKLIDYHWKNDFSDARNKTMDIIREEYCCDWALWTDIDTIFNKNPDNLLRALDKEPIFLYDDIRVPSLRFWDRSHIMGKVTPYPEHWGLLRMSAFKGFVGNLHEQAVVPSQRVLRLTSTFLPGFYLAHYDLAKINAMSVPGSSADWLMGMKKHRYLKIRKLTGTLSPSDPNPDQMAHSDILEFGRLKIAQEVHNNPLSEITVGENTHSKFLKGILS